MDEPENDVASTRRAAVVVAAVLAAAAWTAYGSTGLAVVLVVAAGALALAAFHRTSGRSYARPEWLTRSPRPEPVERVEEDHWRSERWVRESVERGLRSLDAWRFDEQAR